MTSGAAGTEHRPEIGQIWSDLDQNSHGRKPDLDEHRRHACECSSGSLFGGGICAAFAANQMATLRVTFGDARSATDAPVTAAQPLLKCRSRQGAPYGPRLTRSGWAAGSPTRLLGVNSRPRQRVSSNSKLRAPISEHLFAWPFLRNSGRFLATPRSTSDRSANGHIGRFGAMCCSMTSQI